MYLRSSWLVGWLYEGGLHLPVLIFKNTQKEDKMKRIIFTLLLPLLLMGGDWGFENVTSATGTLFSFDTIEAFYSTTMDVANGKVIPAYLQITSFLTPDTATKAEAGDTVNFRIAIDYSNDRSNWWSYGNIDTVALDSATVSACGLNDNSVQIEPQAFRYFRLYLQSMTVDTFEVYLQKSYEE
jgi:hypothetical protein